MDYGAASEQSHRDSRASRPWRKCQPLRLAINRPALFTLIQKFTNWLRDRLVEDVIVKRMQQVFPAGFAVEKLGDARLDQGPCQTGLGGGASRGCEKASGFGVVSHSVTVIVAPRLSNFHIYVPRR